MEPRMGPRWGWIVAIIIGMFFGIGIYWTSHEILSAILIGLSTPAIYTILKLVLK